MERQIFIVNAMIVDANGAFNKPSIPATIPTTSTRPSAGQRASFPKPGARCASGMTGNCKPLPS